MIPGCLFPGMLSSIASTLANTWQNSSDLKTLGWSSTDAAWSSIYVNGQYVIGGYNGKILTSPDGSNYTYQNGLATAWSGGSQVSALGYGQGVYLAGGLNGYLATSPDAINWTNQTALINGPWGSVTVYGFIALSDRIVAFGAFGRVAISTDGGVTWTIQSIPSWGNYDILAGVWTGSQIILVGGNGQIATSPDGVNWTAALKISNMLSIIGVGVVGSQIVAVDLYGSVATSPDGVSWTYRAGLIGAGWPFGISNVTSLYVKGNTVVVAGYNGRVAVSSDSGVTWTMVNSLSTGVWGTAAIYTMVSNGSTLLMGGDAGRFAKTPLTWTSSPTEIAWSFQSSPMLQAWGINTVRRIVYGNGKYLVVGGGGNIAISSNGLNWTYVTTLSMLAGWPPGVLARALVWTGSQFVVGGNNGIVATSPDGLNWTIQTSLASTAWGTTTINDMVMSGSVIVAVGNSGAVATSSDNGVTWVYQSSLSATGWGSYTALAIINAGSMLVVGGGSGKIATSTDNGITWVYRSALTTTAFGTASVFAMVWTGTLIVAVGSSGRCATSPDGANWTYQAGFTSVWGTSSVNAIAWSGQQLIAGGLFARNATSYDAVTWLLRSELSASLWGNQTVQCLTTLNGRTYALSNNAGIAFTS